MRKENFKWIYWFNLLMSAPNIKIFREGRNISNKFSRTVSLKIKKKLQNFSHFQRWQQTCVTPMSLNILPDSCKQSQIIFLKFRRVQRESYDQDWVSKLARRQNCSTVTQQNWPGTWSSKFISVTTESKSGQLRCNNVNLKQKLRFWGKVESGHVWRLSWRETRVSASVGVQKNPFGQLLFQEKRARTLEK